MYSTAHPSERFQRLAKGSKQSPSLPPSLSSPHIPPPPSLPTILRLCWFLAGPPPPRRKRGKSKVFKKYIGGGNFFHSSRPSTFPLRGGSETTTAERSDTNEEGERAACLDPPTPPQKQPTRSPFHNFFPRTLLQRGRARGGARTAVTLAGRGGILKRTVVHRRPFMCHLLPPLREMPPSSSFFVRAGHTPEETRAGRWGGKALRGPILLKDTGKNKAAGSFFLAPYLGGYST